MSHCRPYLFPFHHILRDSFGIPSGWCGKKVGRLLGGWWEDDGRMLGWEWEESSDIFNAVRENIRAADSRCGISRLKKCYQPTQEVLPTDQVNTACRLKKKRLIRYSEWCYIDAWCEYVDFIADVVQPYSQIVNLRPEWAAVHSPGQHPG